MTLAQLDGEYLRRTSWIYYLKITQSGLVLMIKMDIGLVAYILILRMPLKYSSLLMDMDPILVVQIGGKIRVVVTGVPHHIAAMDELYIVIVVILSEIHIQVATMQMHLEYGAYKNKTEINNR